MGVVSNENVHCKRSYSDDHVSFADVTVNNDLTEKGAGFNHSAPFFILLSIYRVFLGESSTQLP